MAIDSPALLNPLPPEEDLMRVATLAPLLNGITRSPGSKNPALHPSPQQNGHPQTSVPAHLAPRQSSQTPSVQPPDTGALPVLPPPRPPTGPPTPHPDFHIDEGSLLHLEFQLKTRTSQLTVEQFEQLRQRVFAAYGIIEQSGIGTGSSGSCWAH